MGQDSKTDLAYERGSSVRIVAELSAHLQVADAADGVPELRQSVGAHHQQSSMRSDEVKLRQEMDIRKLCNLLEEGLVTVVVRTHFHNDIRVENVDGQNDLTLWDHVVHQFWGFANGQTLLGVKHTREHTFCTAARGYNTILICDLMNIFSATLPNNPPVHLRRARVCS